MTFFIPGPAGQTEAEIKQAKNLHAPVAVICHPHPLFGGTMRNKVVTTLSRVFHAAGATTVCFNFRGVGKSEGVHDDGRGELDDLLAVLAWAKKTFSPVAVWLAGFSFGGWIAMKGALQVPVQKLVLVAPMISRLQEENVSALSCSWILVQGDQDEIIDAAAVFAWAASLPNSPVLVRMEGAGHFFHGQLLQLAQRIGAVL